MPSIPQGVEGIFIYSVLLRIFHIPRLNVMTRRAVIDACPVLSVAVGAVLRAAEMIAVVRIYQSDMLLNFARLRIFHAGRVVKTFRSFRKLILIVAGDALRGRYRCKRSVLMTACALNISLSMLTHLRHLSGCSSGKNERTQQD